MSTHPYDPNAISGYSDALNGNYNPPGGTGWNACIADCLLGPSDAREAYQEGYDAGKDAR